MKKQIFALLLCTAIFTTNPLLGMKRTLEDEEKIPTNLTKPNMKLDKWISLSDVFLPEDVIMCIVSILPIKDMFRFSLTSNTMYDLCADPIVSHMNQKECIVDNHHLPVDLAMNEYFSLFKDKTKTYKVTIPQLQAFKREIYLDERPNAYMITYGPRTGNPGTDWTIRKRPKSYCFSIGERKFQIFNRNIFDDKLETLRSDAYVTFVWKSYPYDPNLIWKWNSYPESPDHFYAEVVSCPSNTVVQDLSNSKYLKKDPGDIERVEYIRNYFQVEEII